MDAFENLGIDWKILIGQIINFLILLFLLQKFAYRPFLKVLKERREKIERGIRDSQKAEETIQRIRETREKILKKAQEKALLFLKKSQEEAGKRQEKILKEADEEKKKILIEAEELGRENLKELRKKHQEEVLNLSIALAEKILKEKINRQKDKELIDYLLVNLKEYGQEKAS